MLLLCSSEIGCIVAAAPPVKAWQCQLALALTQVSFCCGSVYLKRALRAVDGSRGQNFHPIVYAFVREAVAAPIMCSMAWAFERKLLGFFLVVNYCCYCCAQQSWHACTKCSALTPCFEHELLALFSGCQATAGTAALNTAGMLAYSALPADYA